MAAELFIPPSKALDANANPYAGAKWFFYATGTTTPQSVYTTFAMGTPHANPVVADSTGKFANIFFDPALVYRGVLKNADGSVTLHDIDPISSSTLATLAASGGSALVTFLQAGTGAVSRTMQAKERDVISVKDFGAVGDSTGAAGSGTDNTAAIQAALNYAASLGGGVVKLPPSAGGYRITAGLKFRSSNLVLEGPWGHGFPFSINGSLVADFSNANQWAIQPNTLVSAAVVPYNVMVNGALPSPTIYNCGVRNLALRVATGGVVPYGGIRFNGCPGAFSENVSIAGFGCGLLVNYSFGGKHNVHCETLYYGIVCWDEANANTFDGYVAQQAPNPVTVPAGYLMPFMSSLSTTLVSTYGLSTNAHHNRPTGIINGSLAATNNCNVFDVVIERFTNGIFSLFSFPVDFRKCYIEKGSGGMLTAIVAAQSTVSVQGALLNLSASGSAFDLGVSCAVDIWVNGQFNTATFGTVSTNADTSLVVRNSKREAFPTPPVQNNVIFERAGAWINLPAAAGGWTNNSFYPPAYRIVGQRLELRGFAGGGPTGVTAIWTLPAGYRPSVLHNVAGGFGAQFSIDTDGTMKIASGVTFGLDGVSVPLT